MPNIKLKTIAAILWTLACVLQSAGLVQAQTALPPAILKVEPPSWWAGHSINPVRLLVRGTNLTGARVTATRPETSPSAVVINPAGTYLFVSVQISAAAQPGDYPLQLETAAGKTTIPFRVNAPLDAATNFQGITNDDVIYLIMPDRFSNGDMTNDAPAGSPTEANDRKNSRAFHGGDLRGIINHLPYLKELGVTALWINPWYDNPNTVNTCDKPWCPNTNYHGYHAIDYYGVEDHFGDLRTLRELVEKAHRLGIKIIQDQVANHVGIQHPWSTNPPLDNWFHGTPTRHIQNPFRGDLLLTPNAAREERRPTLDGWFNDALPDMNQEEPEVARYEIQNALWWIGVTGLDGIRQDTIQYMPRSFIRDLSRALHQEYPKMWMVGEVFDRDPAHTAFFMGGRKGWDGIDTELDSVFDFALWQASLDVFSGKKPVRHLRDTLKYDANYPDALRLTTMLNNHDVKRTISIEGMTLEGAMLHTGFLLTVRGIPQLYYGDEIALPGNDDPDNRRDFPGGFPGDKRSAFTKNGRTPEEQRMYEWTRSLVHLRREQRALRQGHTIDLVYTDDTYVFARRSAGEIIVVAINRAPTPQKTTIPIALIETADGAQLIPLLSAKERIRAAGGSFTFDVPPRTMVAYKLIGAE
ncbi:MAG: neopullulanase [Acidobacteriota bacterium]|nr:neopullulanase [Acidobacteriota bacterium]